MESPKPNQHFRLLQAGVQVLMQCKPMPLLAIFIEPAKVLFLNNAINHGIFTPIGLEQVANTGRSLMFLLEANPGPGFGVLLAYCFFCKDETTRQSAPGAVIIHFLGGIHERAEGRLRGAGGAPQKDVLPAFPVGSRGALRPQACGGAFDALGGSVGHVIAGSAWAIF